MCFEGKEKKRAGGTGRLTSEPRLMTGITDHDYADKVILQLFIALLTTLLFVCNPQSVCRTSPLSRVVVESIWNGRNAANQRPRCGSFTCSSRVVPHLEREPCTHAGKMDRLQCTGRRVEDSCNSASTGKSQEPAVRLACTYTEPETFFHDRQLLVNTIT